MKRTMSVVAWVLLFFGGFALAASPALADTLEEIARSVVETFSSGQYGEAAILAVVLGVSAFRKFLAPRFPFWASDVGGGLLVLVIAFGTTLTASLSAGESLSLGLLWTAFKVAGAASGGYTLVKRLGGWMLARLPLPGWLERALSALLWLFQPRGEEAIAKAEKAGDAAVKSKPPTGVGPTTTL